MTTRRLAAGVVATAIAVAASPAVALADTAAPPGTSEAAALQIQDLIGIAETQATSQSGGGSADAQALTLGGETVSGGTQQGTGEAGDAVFDTGETPLGRLAILPWWAKVDNASGTADARSSLLDLILLSRDVAAISVLQSTSSTRWTPTRSTGSGTTDGATVAVGGEGGLQAVVLHSESNSSGEGEAYLLSLNENKVGTADSADVCTLAVPGLLGLACLAVTGGVGTASATVATATVADGALNGRVLGTAASAGDGAAVLGAGGEAPRTFPAADIDDTTQGGLAGTGRAIAVMTAIGLLLVALGWSMLSARRSHLTV